jgi:hypothetical protein
VPPKLEDAGFLLLTVCDAQDTASTEYPSDLRPIRNIDLSHFPFLPNLPQIRNFATLSE